MLDWLDELPDMRIPGVQGVQGVQPQETAAFACTSASVQRCASTPVHTSAHPRTPSSVQPQPAENRHSTPCTPRTPTKWFSPAGKLSLVGEWARLLQDKAAGDVPGSIAADRWQQVLADAAMFLGMWGEQAVALGWTERDLFAVPPGPERWMRMGLVALLQGRPVVAITADSITIAVRGGHSRYRRSPNMGAVMLWDPRAYSESRQ